MGWESQMYLSLYIQVSKHGFQNKVEDEVNGK